MKEKIKGLIKFTDDYQNKEEIILRDLLALERTKLANESTHIALPLWRLKELKFSIT